MLDLQISLADALTTQNPDQRFVVLHVDDDAASLMMAEGALEEAGFEVIHAENGAEAVTKFHEESPDLIIMDAVMPVMDGFDAIAKIRSLPNGGHIPIMMITGLEDLDSITRAYEEGATDFLTKPISFFTLPYRLQYMLRAKLTADALRTSQAKLDNAQRIARLGHWECAAGLESFTWSREFARVMSLPEDSTGGRRPRLTLNFSCCLKKLMLSIRFGWKQSLISQRQVPVRICWVRCKTLPNALMRRSKSII